MIDEKGRQQLKAVATIPKDAVVAIVELFTEKIGEAREIMDIADTNDTFRQAQGAIAAYKDMIELIEGAKEHYQMIAGADTE